MTRSSAPGLFASTGHDMANALVPIVLVLFVPATYVAIRFLGPRRGVAAALLGGWMFLPVFDGRVAVPVLGTKVTFVPMVVLLVSFALDQRRWAGLRLRRPDLVAAVVCLAPFATALANGLGAYEGASASVDAFGTWVAPYLLGRVYFGSPRAMHALARAIVFAALVYVPLCLWEIRMSPQLHRQLYGYHLFENFGFAVRWGGYRPAVFMNGLMVATFMATGTLVVWWLWRSGAVERVAGIPASWCAAVLAATTVLVKSTAALILLAVGIVALEATRLLRRPLALIVLALLPPAFVGARISGWTAREIPEAAATYISGERAQSVQFRLRNEQALLERAMMRPGLGWGRWGRSRVRDDQGRDVSVTDSLWIISLGVGGLVGLCSLGLLLLVPTLQLLRRYPGRLWSHPAIAPAAALSTATLLWVADCLLNAMVTPVFPTICGATISFAARRWRRRRRMVTQSQPEERLPPAYSTP